MKHYIGLTVLLFSLLTSVQAANGKQKRTEKSVAQKSDFLGRKSEEAKESRLRKEAEAVAVAAAKKNRRKSSSSSTSSFGSGK